LKAKGKCKKGKKGNRKNDTKGGGALQDPFFGIGKTEHNAAAKYAKQGRRGRLQVSKKGEKKRAQKMGLLRI